MGGSKRRLTKKTKSVKAPKAGGKCTLMIGKRDSSTDEWKPVIKRRRRKIALKKDKQSGKKKASKKDTKNNLPKAGASHQATVDLKEQEIKNELTVADFIQEDENNKSDPNYPGSMEESNDDTEGSDTAIILKGFESIKKKDKNLRLNSKISKLLKKAVTEKEEQIEMIQTINNENRKTMTQITRLLMKYNRSQAKAIANFNNINHE